MEKALANRRFPSVKSEFKTKMNSADIKRIMLVTTWRSGSTFLGQVIESAPNVFYTYEPMIYFEYHPGSKADLIRSLFQCQFPVNYLRFVNGQSDKSDLNFMIFNRRAWDACDHDVSFCYQPDFVSQLCWQYPIHLMKTVRLRVKELKPLMEDETFKTTKIIYLVRDPRGVMASRANLSWCQQNPACNDPKRLCSDVQEDLQEFNLLKSQYPDRLYLVNFEELTQNVEPGIKQLFDFLEMTVSPPVQYFLKTHTQQGDKDVKLPYTTFRRSKTVASEWRTKLNQSSIDVITNACSSLIEMLKIKI